MRKEILSNGEIYHIFSRSIADFVIFNDKNDYERIRQLIQYYKINNNRIRYSEYAKYKYVCKEGFYFSFDSIRKDKNDLVQLIAYCIMPTHIHLVLKQLQDKGISQYMKHILDSYSKYFNVLHKRHGPLWESKFKNVHVTSDEQLYHLIRYVHLNPVTAKIINKPEDWKDSSYNEYLGKNKLPSICEYDDLIDIKPSQYKKFVNDQIDYQRQLAKIKKLLLD